MPTDSVAVKINLLSLKTPPESLLNSEGELSAAKSYPSTYSAPDQLMAGEMSMVNQSIDLQEKEKMNEKELAALRAGFKAP